MTASTRARYLLAAAALLCACRKDAPADNAGPGPSATATVTVSATASATEKDGARSPPQASSDGGGVPSRGGAETGTIALTLPSSSMEIVDANGDGTEDLVALARITGANDEQLRVVAYDGVGRRMLWTSPRIRPPGTLPRSAQGSLFSGAGRVALANGWKELELFDLATGARPSPATIALPGIPGRVCVDPTVPSRRYVWLVPVGGPKLDPPGVLVDLAAASASSSPPPTWCDVPRDGCDAFKNDAARAACAGKSTAPPLPGFLPRYVLSGKDATVAIGNAELDGRRAGANMVVRFDPTTKRVLWTRTIEDAPHERNLEDSHAIGDADVTPAGVVLVIDVIGALQRWEQRLLMLDLASGATRFEVALSRPETSAPRVVGTSLYVPRGTSIEQRDPATGTLRRSFGGENARVGPLEEGAPDAGTK